MPAGKPRSKDDTWTPEELSHALKGSKDGDKKKRSRDDDGKAKSKSKTDVKSDDKKSSKKGKDDEEDRERQRQERREKRGGDSKRKEERPRKEDKKETEERPRREESARRHRKRDDDDEGDRKRHKDKDKHRDREDEDDEEREKRRRERRERREKEKRDEGGGDKHEEDDERERRRQERRERRERKDEDRDDRPEDDEERERRRQERRERREKKEDEGDKERKHRSKRDHDDGDGEKKHRDRDKEDRHKDKDRDREKEREERRREREEKKDKGKDKESREERKRREREEEERRKREEEKKNQAEKGGGDDEDDDYGDDDFEDYEDDFEDDEMDEFSPVEKTRKYVIESNTTEGEMEEVLRALDEENARLTSQSQRSNWSDSTELSDERFKEGEGPGHDGRRGSGEGDRGGDSKPARPKTFINFVSAKQRVLNQSQASKARRRADDLRNMIELDTVYYDLFDLPPVREYDLYIRSFGRSNTKQAYVQTNEDAVDRDIQTEEAEDMDKWTQHPAEDIMGGVGGDGISVKSGEDDRSSLANTETGGRLGKFLERAAQAMVILMEEERSGGDEGGGRAGERNSNISVSDGVSQLGCPPYLAGRGVDRVCFCPQQPNMFLTLHSQPHEGAAENALNGYGIICVWNVKETALPQKVLTSLSQPTCACFSPSRAALVIAGMHDGSVMVWDLREAASLHKSVMVDDTEVTTRFPTYNTAGVLDKENHRSPVAAITAVHPTVLRKKPEDSAPTDTEGSLSFQLASVEEAATVNLWVVTEIASPDLAGSEVDLGLAPGGRVKLLRSSAIVLHNPNKLANSTSLKALDIQLSPSDLNHFFVASDMGQIIHGVRFGSRVFPRAYHPQIDDPKKITCLDFSPFGEPYFLAGCEDGSVHLYHTSQKQPLSSWPVFAEGHCIKAVQWSRSRPAVFLVLSANNALFTFDLVETGLLPIKTDNFTTGRVTSMAVASDPALIGGNKNLPAHMLVALDNGTVELHSINNTLRQQQPLEYDFLQHYSDRF